MKEKREIRDYGFELVFCCVFFFVGYFVVIPLLIPDSLVKENYSYFVDENVVTGLEYASQAHCISQLFCVEKGLGFSGYSNISKLKINQCKYFDIGETVSVEFYCFDAADELLVDGGVFDFNGLEVTSLVSDRTYFRSEWVELEFVIQDPEFFVGCDWLELKSMMRDSDE